MLIEDLVLQGETSVRLRNCIQQAAQNDSLPYITVAEYLAAGPNARFAFQSSVRSFGAKTARELDELINGFQSVSLKIPDEAEKEEQQKQALAETLSGLKVKDLLGLPREISTRLKNSLKQFGHLAEQGVFQFISQPKSEKDVLLRLPNFGRKSLRELERLCHFAIASTLTRLRGDEDRAIEDCKCIFANITNLNDADISDLVREARQWQAQKDLTLQELLQAGLDGLDTREAEILRRRYGFQGGGGETLETIGLDFSVTRERIRQLEVKAKKKLVRSLGSRLLYRALSLENERIWSQIGQVIPFKEASLLARELEPQIALSLDLLNLTLEDWLCETGERMSGGVLGPSFSKVEVKAVAKSLNGELYNRALPLPVAQLNCFARDEVLRAAFALETPYVLSEGYIFKKRPGVRLKRAVRAHASMAIEGGLLSLSSIWERYRERFEDDRCSSRDIDMVMDAFPHLFLEIEDGVWSAIGLGGELPEGCGEGGDDPVDHPSEEEVTIAGALMRELRERGPSSISSLINESDSYLPAGRSANSVGPILLSYPEKFCRVLPGVYALCDELPTAHDLKSETASYFLNEEQARLYAIGRRAGEAWGAFHLWTPLSEFVLCRWARFEAEPSTFRSLLAICQPNEWPVDPTTQNEWHRLSQKEGRFELTVGSIPSCREQRPELERLLAASIAVQERGSTNWFMLNRILRKRLDSRRSTELLGLLVALQIVEIPAGERGEDAWQMKHKVGPGCRSTIQLLTEELGRTGELEWEGRAGQLIIERLHAARDNDVSWVDFSALLDIFAGDVEGTSMLEVEEGPGVSWDEDDLESLLRQHKRNAAKKRRAELSRLLLEE